MAVNEQVAALMERVKHIEEAAEERKEQQDSMAADVKEIKDQLTKYKGFIGGVVFVCSCIGAFVYYLTGPLASFLKFKNG